MVFTTVPRARLSAGEVLELYRIRWQVELVFKRFNPKSEVQLSDTCRITTEALRKI